MGEFSAVVAAAEVGEGTAAAGQVGDACVPLEVLEQRLTGLASRIAAAEAQWLGWLADYDEREGWQSWGCVSAAHWLSWRCGLGATAARERVRAARALRGLPLIDEQFRAGRLTWSKVRALTRVANEHNEADLVDIAVNATGSQLDRICRAKRNVGGTETQSAAVAFASRSWSKRTNHDGTTTYSLRVTDDAAALIDRTLERQVTATLDDATGPAAAEETAEGEVVNGPRSRRSVIDERNGIAAVRSDAATALLTGTATADPIAADVTLTIDNEHQPNRPDVAGTPAGRPSSTPTASEANVPAGTSPTEPIAFHTAGQHLAHPVGQRLCCDPRVTALIETTTRIDAGRSQRFVTSHLKRALDRRDGHACAFPGCAAEQRLHAHHIIHWTDGGPTDLNNLIWLCHFHHHLVHDTGWTIDPTTRTFRRPTGTAINPSPTIADALNQLNVTEPPLADFGRTPAHSTPANPAPLAPPDLHPLDLDWAIAVLADNEQINRNRDARPTATADVPAGTSAAPAPLGEAAAGARIACHSEEAQSAMSRSLAAEYSCSESTPSA